jgi:hypothetical protein
VDMIPLLVEKGFRPKGWLGLILGCAKRFLSLRGTFF